MQDFDVKASKDCMDQVVGVGPRFFLGLKKFGYSFRLGIGIDGKPFFRRT